MTNEQFPHEDAAGSPDAGFEAAKERFAELSAEVVNINERYAALAPLQERAMAILGKEQYQEAIWQHKDWSDEFKRALFSPDELKSYDEYQSEFKKVDAEYCRVLENLVELVSENPELVTWVREQETGVEGSYSKRAFRDYFAVLPGGENSGAYALKISRCEWPKDGYYGHPSGRDTVDYQVSVVGSREVEHKGLFTAVMINEPMPYLDKFIAAEKDIESARVSMTKDLTSLGNLIDNVAEQETLSRKIADLGDRLKQVLG